MFADIILTTTENFQSSKEIHVHIDKHMDLWEKVHFAVLVLNTVTYKQGVGVTRQGGTTSVREGYAMWAYNCTLLSGKHALLDSQG